MAHAGAPAAGTGDFGLQGNQRGWAQRLLTHRYTPFPALGAALAASGYLLLLSRGSVLDSALLLRVPFLFATGLTYGFLVTKSREAHARASAAERAMDAMSHEIRSPLSAIIRYSEALRMGRVHNLTPAQRAGIAQINADAV